MVNEGIWSVCAQRWSGFFRLRCVSSFGDRFCLFVVLLYRRGRELCSGKISVL